MKLKYWVERFREQGARYVGHVDHSPEEHAAFYDRKREFISEHIPDHVRVLDFGCGVGMYATLFKKSAYMGVDVLRSAVMVANGDGYEYQVIKKYSDIIGKYDLIFCANVLQRIEKPHKILKAWARLLKCGHILLFENYKDKADHVWGRTPTEYRALVGNYFDVKNYKIAMFSGNNALMKFGVYERKI